MRLVSVSILVPRPFAMIGSSAVWMRRRPVSIFATVLRVTCSRCANSLWDISASCRVPLTTAITGRFYHTASRSEVMCMLNGPPQAEGQQGARQFGSRSSTTHRLAGFQ